MKRRDRNQLSYRLTLRIVKMLNVLLIVLPVVIGWRVFYKDHVGIWSESVTLLVAAVYVLLYSTYGRVYDSFLVSVYPVSEMIYSQSLALLISDGFLYCIFVLMAHRLIAVLPLLVISLFLLVFAPSTESILRSKSLISFSCSSVVASSVPPIVIISFFTSALTVFHSAISAG